MICAAALTLRDTHGPALQFLDVAVAQGGVVLLRGASGSGKPHWWLQRCTAACRRFLMQNRLKTW